MSYPLTSETRISAGRHPPRPILGRRAARRWRRGRGLASARHVPRPEVIAWLQKAVERGYRLVEIQRNSDFAAFPGELEVGKLALAAPAAKPSTPSTGVKR